VLGNENKDGLHEREGEGGEKEMKGGDEPIIP
jgi:hypothetical protein